MVATEPGVCELGVAIFLELGVISARAGVPTCLEGVIGAGDGVAIFFTGSGIVRALEGVVGTGGAPNDVFVMFVVGFGGGGATARLVGFGVMGSASSSSEMTISSTLKKSVLLVETAETRDRTAGFWVEGAAAEDWRCL